MALPMILLPLSLLAMSSLTPPVGTATSADGVPIHYEVTGQGEPTLVFVHGWAIDSRYWDAQVPVLARTHRLVTLDLAGHGRSGRGRKDWTVAAFAQDVRAVVEALSLRKVVLVGHSMSGNVILEAAKLLPGRVSGLIPVDTLLDVDQQTKPEELAQVLAALRADYRGAATGFSRQLLFAEKGDPAFAEKVLADLMTLPPEISIKVLEGSLAYDPRPALKDVKIPIVAVNADKFPTRLDHARAYAPQFDALIVKGMGHYLMREDPAAFNAQLARAVALVTGAAAPREPR
jgi:pimeloyl-ACP methyl ester carboxylesterase